MNNNINTPRILLDSLFLNCPGVAAPLSPTVECVICNTPITSIVQEALENNKYCRLTLLKDQKGYFIFDGDCLQTWIATSRQFTNPLNRQTIEKIDYFAMRHPDGLFNHIGTQKTIRNELLTPNDQNLSPAPPSTECPLSPYLIPTHFLFRDSLPSHLPLSLEAYCPLAQRTIPELIQEALAQKGYYLLAMITDEAGHLFVDGNKALPYLSETFVSPATQLPIETVDYFLINSHTNHAFALFETQWEQQDCTVIPFIKMIADLETDPHSDHRRLELCAQFFNAESFFLAEGFFATIKDPLLRSSYFEIAFQFKIDDENKIDFFRMREHLKSQNSDDPKELFAYACMLDEGQGGPEDRGEARKLYKKAADKGHLEARFNYAVSLYESENEPESKEKARILFKELADNGNLNALFKYAYMLDNSEGGPENKEEARKLYNQAATKGHLIGLFHYAYMLDNGLGGPACKEEARKLYKNAADRGVLTALHNYATMVDAGEGGPEDKKEARILFKQLAEKGHEEGRFSYAVMLDEGEGGPENKVKARILYKKAADKGNLNALISYANMLKRGEGGPKDKVEARILYKKAADQEHLDGLVNYAWMLEKGDGGPKDKVEARKLYKKAADKGDLEALSRYQRMVEAGEGEPEAGKRSREADDQAQPSKRKKM